MVKVRLGAEILWDVWDFLILVLDTSILIIGIMVSKNLYKYL